MMILGTKIKQETINYCKGNGDCEKCKCCEEECIAELYYILHEHEDV